MRKKLSISLVIVGLIVTTGLMAFNLSTTAQQQIQETSIWFFKLKDGTWMQVGPVTVPCHLENGNVIVPDYWPPPGIEFPDPDDLADPDVAGRNTWTGLSSDTWYTRWVSFETTFSIPNLLY